VSGAIGTWGSTGEEVVEGSGPLRSLRHLSLEAKLSREGGNEGRVLEFGRRLRLETLGRVGDAVIHPGRDEDGGNAKSESLEVEGHARRGLAVLAIGVRNTLHRRRLVVIKASVLVVGEEEGRGVPGARVAQLLINVLDERFSQ